MTDHSSKEQRITGIQADEHSRDAFSTLESAAAHHHLKDTENEENFCAEDEDEIDDFTLHISSDETDTEEAQFAADEKTQESEDALSAVASAAALNHSKDFNKTDTVEKESVNGDNDAWHTVGFIKGTSFNVQNYFHCKDDSSCTVDNLADYSHLARINLEPGTAYKFRVAAINSVGRGEWSEVSTFKTLLPGLPEVPCGIKISISSDGAHLSWEPPSAAQGEILEYSVYLAVNVAGKPVTDHGPSTMTFVRVYCGASNTCTVPSSFLAAAYLYKTTKTAIIFRISARNNKGYGPALQVRWLQDSQTANEIAKRGAENVQANIKRFKIINKEKI